MADVVTRDANPLKNPSYPARVHIHERARFLAVLAGWDQRIQQARAELSETSSPARRDLFAQMLGARDQVADTVRRLPMEVGDLYEEDHHRLHEAEAALERLFARWSETR